MEWSITLYYQLQPRKLANFSCGWKSVNAYPKNCFLRHFSRLRRFHLLYLCCGASNAFSLSFSSSFSAQTRTREEEGEWSLCAFFRRRHDFTAVLPSVWCIVSGERGFVYFYGFSGVVDSHNFNISIASVFRKTSLLVQTQRASKRFTTIAFKFSRSFHCIKFLEMTLFFYDHNKANLSQAIFNRNDSNRSSLHNKLCNEYNYMQIERMKNKRSSL